MDSTCYETHILQLHLTILRICGLVSKPKTHNSVIILILLHLPEVFFCHIRTLSLLIRQYSQRFDLTVFTRDFHNSVFILSSFSVHFFVNFYT